MTRDQLRDALLDLTPDEVRRLLADLEAETGADLTPDRPHEGERSVSGYGSPPLTLRALVQHDLDAGRRDFGVAIEHAGDNRSAVFKALRAACPGLGFYTVRDCLAHPDRPVFLGPEPEAARRLLAQVIEHGATARIVHRALV